MLQTACLCNVLFGEHVIPHMTTKWSFLNWERGRREQGDWVLDNFSIILSCVPWHCARECVAYRKGYQTESAITIGRTDMIWSSASCQSQQHVTSCQRTNEIPLRASRYVRSLAAAGALVSMSEMSPLTSAEATDAVMDNRGPVPRVQCLMSRQRESRKVIVEVRIIVSRSTSRSTADQLWCQNPASLIDAAIAMRNRVRSNRPSCLYSSKVWYELSRARVLLESYRDDHVIHAGRVGSEMSKEKVSCRRTGKICRQCRGALLSELHTHQHGLG